MTQDQSGSAVRGDVLPDESADRPMTRFQKVASALRGDKPDQAQDETSQDGAPTDPDVTAVTRPDGVTAGVPVDPVGPVGPAGPADPADLEGSRDYWDDPRAARGTEDHAATQPDVFGSTARPDPGESPVADPGESPVATEPSITEPSITEPSAAGTPAAGLRPGQATDAPGGFADIAYGDLIPGAAEFRQQWQQIQFKFVDDPRASVTEAADAVAQVTARLEAAIAERQRVISERQRALRSRWDEGSSADTETLRETLRMYRAFLDQLLGSR